VAIVKVLIDAFPQSIKIKNRFGEYPFDRAYNSKNYEVLDYLVSRWPSCLVKIGGDGEIVNTPILRYFNRRKRAEVMRMFSLSYKVRHEERSDEQ